MIRRLLKASVCAATLLALWHATPEAQAQYRGGSGFGVRFGNSGFYGGPNYGRYDGGRYYDRRYGDRYDNRSFGGRYGYGYDSRYYGTRTYGATPRVWSDDIFYVPSTTQSYQSYYAPAANTPAVSAPAVSASTARINVRVSDPNAEIWFNGSRTQQRGADRVFETPSLSDNSSNTYEIRARWTGADGQTMERTRTIQVEPGREVTVDFTRG